MELIVTVFRKQPFLTTAGAIHVGLALLMLIGLAFDSRTILGLNPWVKPLKFALSIAVYLFSLALFLSYFPSGRKLLSWAGVTIAVTMLVEILLISIQALRGTTSHFNVSTSLDAGIFTLMGIAVAVNTLAVAVILWEYFAAAPPLAAAYLWGIRLGLVIFIAGTLQGFLMASRGAHTVGAPDGGAGLPFVNWSTRFGDLRVAHFIGLHALQGLPIVGWLVSGGNKLENDGLLSTVMVFGVAGFIAGVMGWALLQALGGRPLISAN